MSESLDWTEIGLSAETECMSQPINVLGGAIGADFVPH